MIWGDDMDISELLKNKPFDCIDMAIGKLYVFGISPADKEELKDLGITLDESDPTEYIRNLIPFICYPEEHLKEGKYQPEEPILTLADVNKLTDENIAEIARTYIANNDYLYKKLESIKTEDEEGNEKVSSKYTEIIHPQEALEDSIQYLFRLFVIEEEKQKRQMKKLLDSVNGLNTFSSKLTSRIQDTLSLGDSLRKISELQVPTFAGSHESADTLNRSFIDYHQIEKQQRLKPFNELGEKLDKLIESHGEAISFAVTANEIQVEIAKEVKSSSDSATKHSKTNIWLTKFVIFLAIISPLASIYISYKSDEIYQLGFKVKANEVVDGVTGIEEQLVKMGASSDRTFRQLFSELKDEKYIYDLFFQRNKILEKSNADQLARINQLEERLLIVENNGADPIIP